MDKIKNIEESVGTFSAARPDLLHSFNRAMGCLQRSSVRAAEIEKSISGTLNAAVNKVKQSAAASVKKLPVKKVAPKPAEYKLDRLPPRNIF
jgi:hypothetical protein